VSPGRRWLVPSVVVLVLFTGCTSGDEGSEPAGTTAEPVALGEPMRLSVFEYNVEYAGDETTDAVIADVDADVVGVLESYNRLPEMAANAGYPYYNVSLQILSKYPILEPSGAEGRYAFIEVRPGQVVAFFNIHLDYVNYGPRALRHGHSVEDVIAKENEVRTSSLDEPLRLMRDLIDGGYAVFFTGDHNEPSSLDWTQATAEAREDIDQAVAWPVSEAILEAGFRDTYREIHPDPVAEPGITHQGVGDRIDYVYAAGPSETLDSQLVGEPGGRDVDLAYEPWTSDHRAVVSTFHVTPARMQTMVAVSPALLTQGDPLSISYHAPSANGSVVVMQTDAADGTADVTEHLTEATGSFDVDTASLAPGGYDAVLLDGDGAQLARVGLWVRDPNAAISVTTDKSSYAAGEPIVVSWTGGPANRWDWIGVYEADKADPKVDSYLDWNYTGLHASGTLPPAVDGSVAMDETAQGGPWPLPPGRYVVHYLVTDRYRSIGSASFTVEGS
jgi:Endonuclease/Exonuclease/phosphatase family